MDDTDMGTWQYNYNALGQLTGQTGARSCNMELDYNLRCRLRSKTYTPGSCGAVATSKVTNYHVGTIHWQPFECDILISMKV